jgi:hypothetical protein
LQPFELTQEDISVIGLSSVEPNVAAGAIALSTLLEPPNSALAMLPMTFIPVDSIVEWAHRKMSTLISTMKNIISFDILESIEDVHQLHQSVTLSKYSVQFRFL